METTVFSIVLTSFTFILEAKICSRSSDEVNRLTRSFFQQLPSLEFGAAGILLLFILGDRG